VGIAAKPRGRSTSNAVIAVAADAVETVEVVDAVDADRRMLIGTDPVIG
jgi:hypothetical protein